MTEPPNKSVLLAAVPGPLRNALQSLLLSLDPINDVVVAGDPEGTMQIIESNLPNLIVLVMDTDPSWEQLPARIRTAAPASRLVVLVDHQTDIGSADVLLQQGIRPESLVTALLSLISDSTE